MPIKLNGGLNYALCEPDSWFAIEEFNGNYLISLPSSGLYLHAWGGDFNGAPIKLNGDRNYAANEVTSQFAIEQLQVTGRHLISIISNGLYFHAYGGNSRGMPIALHMDRDYAVAQPDSQFLLEPVVGPHWSDAHGKSCMQKV